MAAPLRILCAVLKGGAGKSTTVMMLAFAFARRGKNVLVIDADAGTQGVTDWGSRYYMEHPDGEGLPFDLVQYTPRSGLLVPFVQQKIKELEPDIVLLDVGGEAPEVLSQAAIFADLVLTPLAPTQAELSRVAATKTVIQQARRGSDTPMLISLNRVDRVGTGSAAAVRDALETDGYTVVNTEIENKRTRYADVWGRIPAHLGNFGPLADELIIIAKQYGKDS